MSRSGDLTAFNCMGMRYYAVTSSGFSAAAGHRALLCRLQAIVSGEMLTLRCM